MATQRRGASGQPSGTDGSDYSYRMVVDSRYQRVVEGRSRLARLILVQLLHQVAGGALLLLSLSKGKEVNNFAVLSAAAGLLAIVVGELGRRQTMAVLVRLYTSLSSIAVAFSVTCIIRSELFFKVMNKNTEAITSYEMFDAVRVALEDGQFEEEPVQQFEEEPQVFAEEEGNNGVEYLSDIDAF